MLLAFDSSDLRALCKERSRLQDKFGEGDAAEIVDSLADLRASPYLSDFPFPNALDAIDELTGRFVLHTGNAVDIEFVQNHPTRKNDLGRTDRISRVKIVSLDKRQE